MSESEEVIIEKTSNNLEKNFDDFIDNNPHEKETTIVHTKRLCVASGNINGKGVIQDLFTCAGTLPMLGGSILNKTSGIADAISLLIVELERQFVPMHPSIQRILLEFSNIHDPSLKHVATIFLAYEFGHIMKEAHEIFAHYNINCGCPPIEEILFN